MQAVLSVVIVIILLSAVISWHPVPPPMFRDSAEGAEYFHRRSQKIQSLADAWRSANYPSFCAYPNHSYQWGDITISKSWWWWRLSEGPQDFRVYWTIQAALKAAQLPREVVDRWVPLLGSLNLRCIAIRTVRYQGRQIRYITVGSIFYRKPVGFLYAPASDPGAQATLQRWSQLEPGIVPIAAGWYYSAGEFWAAELASAEVSGRLLGFKGRPAADLPIRITCAYHCLEKRGQTDSTGSFRLQGLTPGRYRICAVLPAPYSGRSREWCFPGPGVPELAKDIVLRDDESRSLGEITIPGPDYRATWPPGSFRPMPARRQ